MIFFMCEVLISPLSNSSFLFLACRLLYVVRSPYEQLGDRSRALEAFERAREIDPSHADSCARIGAIKGAMGDHDAAVRYALEALASEPLHADGQDVLDAANAALAGGLCDEGESLLDSGDEVTGFEWRRGR
jgi:tetratricopeptide (TPR) repeat protein